MQLGVAIRGLFLLLFKSLVLIERLLGLPILVVVLLAVEGGLSFEVSSRPFPHLLDVLLHQHGYMYSLILLLSQGFALSFLGSGPRILEGLDHRDVKRRLVVYLVTTEAICILDRASIHAIHDGEPRNRILGLDRMDQHECSVDLLHFSPFASVITTGNSVVCLHILLCRPLDIFQCAQCRLANHLVGFLLDLIEQAMSGSDLITEESSFVCIGDKVLDSDLLGIFRAEVVPINLRYIEKSEALRFFNDCLLHFFLNLLSCEQLPLSLDQLVPLSLCQIVLSCGRLECSFDLLSLLVI